MTWLGYALLSALFAAVTAILAKIGVKDIDSNLATAIRTVVILFFAWGIVLFQQTQHQLRAISKFSLVFLVLSGLATGMSWLFYFKALQLGTVSQVATIDKLSLIMTILLSALILKEHLSPMVLGGAALMVSGAILVALGK